MGAIRVLARSGGSIVSFNPNFDNNLWAAYNPKTDILKNGSNLISQITDLSGNSRHLTQTNDANKPTWISGENGGTKAVRAADLLATTTGPSTSVTFYLCCTIETWAANRVFLQNNNGAVYCTQAGSSPALRLATNYTGLLNFNAPLNEKQIIVVQYYDKVASSINAGNIFEGSTSTFTAFDLIKLIGLDVTFHEILIRQNKDNYDTILNCVNYLRSRNNITVSEAELLVFGGQSNILGRDVFTNITSDVKYKQTQTKGFIYYLYGPTNIGSRVMEAYNPDVNACSDTADCFGCENSLIYELSVYKNKDIYASKYGMAGTAIFKDDDVGDLDWNVLSSSELLDRLKLQITESLRALQQKNLKGRITHFIWMQGEQDALISQGAADLYQQNLTDLIQNVKSYIASNNFANKVAGLKSVVIGRIHDTAQWPYRATVRAAQATVAANLGCILIDTDSYTLLADQKHYTANSQIQFGIDVFNQIKNL